MRPTIRPTATPIREGQSLTETTPVKQDKPFIRVISNQIKIGVVIHAQLSDLKTLEIQNGNIARKGSGKEPS